MKKIFLTIFVITFTALSSNAAAIVNYGVGGVPLSMQLGTRKYSTVGNYYHFGENALASPQNIAKRKIRRINREIARRNSIAGYYPRTRNQAGVLPPPPPGYGQALSRFDRNYRVNTPRHSYTKNGITYYN